MFEALQDELTQLRDALLPSNEQKKLVDIEGILQLVNKNSTLYWPRELAILERNGKLDANIRYLIYLQSAELLGQDVLAILLEEKKQKSDEKQKERLDASKVIKPGDTLAIYIQEVLPFTRPDQPQTIPVVQAGKRASVTGVPVPVSVDGEIILPIIPSLNVAGLTVDRVRELIEKKYVENTILKPGFKASVNFLVRVGETTEIRMISGQLPEPAR